MNETTMTWGRVEISLRPAGEAGWSYFSDPITLESPGTVFIDLALEQAGGGRIFGSPDVFEGEPEVENSVSGELAAALSPDGSSFRIGIRLKEDTEVPAAVVYWRAASIPRESGARRLSGQEQDLVDHYFNAKKEKSRQQAASEFYITGTPKYLYKGNKFMFSCHVPEGTADRVNWKVNGVDAGSIDSYGLYTAPDRVGVFEIEASLGDPIRMRTTIFVMIKEPEVPGC